jgi:hypothetical protein
MIRKIVSEVIKYMTKPHPADVLAALREQLATLQAEQRRLEGWLIEHPDDRRGAEFAATIFYSRVMLAPAEDVPVAVKPPDDIPAQPAKFLEVIGIAPGGFYSAD